MTDKSAFRMAGRSLLKLGDLTDGELLQLLQLSADLKQRRADGIRGDLLARRHIALIFEKLSTRTRCAFTVAVSDEGGYAECLSRKDIHLGKKESVADTARVLGRMFDGIMFRGFAQTTAPCVHGSVVIIRTGNGSRLVNKSARRTRRRWHRRSCTIKIGLPGRPGASSFAHHKVSIFLRLSYIEI